MISENNRHVCKHAEQLRTFSDIFFLLFFKVLYKEIMTWGGNEKQSFIIYNKTTISNALMLIIFSFFGKLDLAGPSYLRQLKITQFSNQNAFRITK